MSDYESSCCLILGLSRLSKWDKAYIDAWHKSGVDINMVQKAVRIAEDRKARHIVRYADAVIRSFVRERDKTAGELRGSFDTDAFFRKAVNKSYGRKEDSGEI